MDETEYRQTYREVNTRKCVFEKAINSRRCTCSVSERFNLADREGVACRSAEALARCQALLESLRNNASFALQMTRICGPLPHAREIKVQVGGMLGIQQVLDTEKAGSESVQDIDGLVRQALSRFGDVAALPYDEIVKAIVRFEGRLRRRSQTKKE